MLPAATKLDIHHKWGLFNISRNTIMKRAAKTAAGIASRRRLTKMMSQSAKEISHDRSSIRLAPVKRHHSTSASSLSSGISYLTYFFKDVVRTGSFNPPNPSLQSLDFPKLPGNSQSSLVSPLYQLPKFSAVLPYHLETAPNMFCKLSRWNWPSWKGN
jgi:hypothetical protein